MFWSRVDIGVDGNAWVDTSTNYKHSTEHSVNLSSSGTYRITTEFVIGGANGTADEIIYEDEITY